MSVAGLPDRAELGALLTTAFGPGFRLTPTAMLPLISDRSIRELIAGLAETVQEHAETGVLGIPMTQRVVVHRVDEVPQAVQSRVDETAYQDGLFRCRLSTWSEPPEQCLASWKVWVIDLDHLAQGLSPKPEAVSAGSAETPQDVTRRLGLERLNFTPSLVDSYCQAIDDLNPFHTFPEVARDIGLEDSNVPATLLSQLLIAKAESDELKFDSVQVRFKRWVYASESVELHRGEQGLSLFSPTRGSLVEARFSIGNGAVER